MGGTAVVQGNGVEENEPVAEEGDCEVVLTSIGNNKVSVVKAIRDACGLSLAAINTLCSALPSVVATEKTISEAQSIKKAIEAAGGTAEINEPKSEWNVVLTSVGTNRIAVVKAVKEACGIGLGIANELTKEIPAVVATVENRNDADEIIAAIEAAGGTAKIE